MKKPDFLTAVTELKIKENRLRLEYIHHNKKFNPGDRVRVKLKSRNTEIQAVVSYNIINVKNDVVPILYPIKGDGTIGKVRLHLFPNDEILPA